MSDLRTMTDTLRTRIAAVICGMDALHAKQWSLAVADAVIRELGLHREPGRHIPGVYIDPKTGSWIINPDAVEEAMAGNPTAHRYVTEWTADDV